VADVEEADVVVSRRSTSHPARLPARTVLIVAAALTGATALIGAAALGALGLAALTGSKPGWDVVGPPALVALVALALAVLRRRSRRVASVPAPAVPPTGVSPPLPEPPTPPPAPGSALRDPPPTAVPPTVTVLEGGSSAGRAPWRLPTRPGPPGAVVDGGRVGGLDVRAASIVGPAHRCDEPAAVRQDAYALAQDGHRTHLVIAVADGLSSGTHSDVGARIAVSTASRELVAALDRGGDPSFDARRLFSVVAGEIVGTGRDRGLAERDLCCLLVVAVVPIRPDPDGGRRVWTAQIGDLSVWTLGRQWQQETGPHKSGLDRNTVTAVLPFHPDAVVTAELVVPAGHRLAVVTDGVGDLLCDVASAKGFLAARWGAGPPHPAAFLADLSVDAPGQDDDRTAVVVWCPAADGGAPLDPPR
jgi:hypothetical protein